MYINTMHTYTLYYSVIVQIDDCDLAGLFVFLYTGKTWPQHGYCKVKHTFIILQTEQHGMLSVRQKKLNNEDVFRIFLHSFTLGK